MDSTITIKDKYFIMDYAYANNYNVKKIVIPDSIIIIGAYSFFNNINLTEVEISNNITQIKELAFAECHNLEKISLPNTLKSIGYKAFSDCKNLKKIIIPEGVESIGFGAFAECHSLEEIYLPNSLKTLEPQIFLNCKNLKKIHLPEGIDYLPDEFFKGCETLNITLPKNIKKLGKGVFQNCKSLTNFPNDVIEFGNSCFKNCSNLNNIFLNTEVSYLPNSCFEGCRKLNNICSESESITIGKRAFRNCISLNSIPDFISTFNRQAFENCISITEIDIKNKVIPMACFRGCINLTNIKNQDKVNSIESYAFSNTGVEEFTFNTPIIPSEVLSNCRNLKRLKLNTRTLKVKSRAFYNCPLLENTFLPDSVEEIGKEAYARCHSIKEFTVPANLKNLVDGAFSFMDSLEVINSPYNKKFITPDHKILIDQQRERLVLYANGIKDESYSIENYCFETDEIKCDVIKPITLIGEYAFAGAKNLRELTLCTCTQDIEYTAFLGCVNLDTLNVKVIPLYSSQQFNIRDHGKYIFSNNIKPFLPFKKLNYYGDSLHLFNEAMSYFDNLEEINFNDLSFIQIGARAFYDANKVKKVYIPNSVKSIGMQAFNEKTILEFENGLEIDGLEELTFNNDYIGEYKLYSLSKGEYYIEDNDQIVSFNIKDIENTISFSGFVVDKPVLFYDYIKSLKNYGLEDQNLLLNGILISTLTNENRLLLLEHYDELDEYFIMGLKYSGILTRLDVDTRRILNDDFNIFINYINLMRKYEIKDPNMYHRVLMTNYPLDNLEDLIQYDYEMALSILKKSNLVNKDDIEFNEDFIKEILSGNEFSYNKEAVLKESNKLISYTIACAIFNSDNNKLLQFIKLIKKYNLKDSFLINPIFITSVNSKFFDLFLSLYDSNLKRLLKESKVLDNQNSAIDNFNDLLKLLYITGALSENKEYRQKMQTFITEKILMSTLANGNKNNYCINGDDIHRVFNYHEALIYDFDLEFANFFLENYYELYKEEKKQAGFIERAYLNFQQISKTSTSDKGSQRHLKVLMKKVKNYLANTKFDNVTKQNAYLAEFIGKWYDDNRVWLLALNLMEEAKAAPRNIFTKITYDEKNNPIYDNDPKKDLIEKISDDYSYEWLPKQYKENLVLGKYCNCCAHLNGAGSGIMRSSMILDCVQNLVINDNNGEIISKITFYVNREKGYGVFNTVETSFNHKTPEELKKIYNAFMRGIKAFVDIYNYNNPDRPLTIVTIGTNRNTIIKELNENEHPDYEVLASLKFGEYSFNNSGYAGDWSYGQKLVLKI